MEEARIPFDIERHLLRDQVRNAVLKMVHREMLAPGEKVNESSLAEGLGVSRTPLREALLTLEYEGVVRSVPGKGYFIRALSRKELAELFAVMSMLERRALELSEGTERSIVQALQAINTQAEAAIEQADRELTLELNAKWHRTLLSGCPNRELLRLIAMERRRLYRYGYLYVRDEGLLGGVQREHHQMIDILSRGDLEEAVEFLDEHWRSAAAAVLGWVESREGTIREASADTG